MKLPGFLNAFGFTKKVQKALSGVGNAGLWNPIIYESFPGAWQQNIELKRDSLLSYYAVFACISLLAADISKMPIKSIIQDDNGIWVENKRGKYNDLIRRPNNYQNRMQFVENWILSKLIRGNTYVLKQRKGGPGSAVERLYILNPDLVMPLVSESGEVYYQLTQDNLADLPQSITVPASEIIHDRFNCFFHPLVGLPPLFACGLAAANGLSIQRNSSEFHVNQSRPSGILVAPGPITNEKAKEMKESWEANFGGKNKGRIAVLGDGLKFEPMQMTAIDSQLVEQLKLSGEMVCSVYHVPPYKVGIGAMPSYNNIQALNSEYYIQGLQSHIESIELCLDEGLNLQSNVGLEFDTEVLLRMDSQTQATVMKEQIASGILSPNEARKKINMPPVPGGEFPLIQQQNYSLPALAKRDTKDNPFETSSAAPSAQTDTPPPDDAATDDQPQDENPEAQKSFAQFLIGELNNVQYAS